MEKKVYDKNISHSIFLMQLVEFNIFNSEFSLLTRTFTI